MHVDSYISKKCFIAKSPIEGRGVFAKKKIFEGDLILIWGGRVLTTDELKKISKRNPHFDFYPVGIAEGFYMAPSNEKKLDDAYRINHSCNPNAGVQGQILLVARRDILPGEEIFFDYETTDIVNMSFDCFCGSTNCRKKINGSSWRKKKFQKSNSKYLSFYIKQKLLF